MEELGYGVRLAQDGLEAWEAYRVQPVRLVICDWLMPRMNGLELVKRIRAANANEYTYIILVTANVGERANYIEAMESGVDDFIAKPIDRTELEWRIRVARRIIEANSRIKNLESMLTVCAYTKRINFPQEGWQSLEEFMRNHLGVTVSHGIDPEYYENTLKPQLESLVAAGKVDGN